MIVLSAEPESGDVRRFTIAQTESLLHATRGEWEMVAGNTVLGLAAAFVAWGRTRKVPIEARHFGRLEEARV